MSRSVIKVFKRNLGPLAVVAAIGVYIVVAGKSGSCPTCVAITDAVGLTSEKPVSSEVSSANEHPE